jgi:hypothetical protein
MKHTAFWDMMLCGLVNNNHLFIQLSYPRKKIYAEDGQWFFQNAGYCYTTQCNIPEKIMTISFYSQTITHHTS